MLIFPYLGLAFFYRISRIIQANYEKGTSQGVRIFILKSIIILQKIKKKINDKEGNHASDWDVTLIDDILDKMKILQHDLMDQVSQKDTDDPQDRHDH